MGDWAPPLVAILIAALILMLIWLHDRKRKARMRRDTEEFARRMDLLRHSPPPTSTAWTTNAFDRLIAGDDRDFRGNLANLAMKLQAEGWEIYTQDSGAIVMRRRKRPNFAPTELGALLNIKNAGEHDYVEITSVGGRATVRKMYN